MTKTDPRALFERLVATIPGVERKGDTIPYTSVNGHMFSNLTKAGKLALRLPDDAREAFLAKYKAKLSVEYGVVRKEYVEVPDALLAKTSELQPYFATSYAWVKAMKPKPTTKRKKAGK
jgi:TfoX/Sxy family transcriptional regulator of competence genes